MNIKEMIIKELKELGADGLYNDEDYHYEPCGCSIEDLCPCGEGMSINNCVAAKKKGKLFYPLKK